MHWITFLIILTICDCKRALSLQNLRSAQKLETIAIVATNDLHGGVLPSVLSRSDTG